VGGQKSESYNGLSIISNFKIKKIQKRYQVTFILQFKKTPQAYELITLPLREGKIFCKKILGGVKIKSRNCFFWNFFVCKRFIFFFEKDSPLG